MRSVINFRMHRAGQYLTFKLFALRGNIIAEKDRLAQASKIYCCTIYDTYDVYRLHSLLFKFLRL